MGGPNLEIFKFSLYLFVPIAALVHFGDPEWYRRHVVPVCMSLDMVVVKVEVDSGLKYRDRLFPGPERTSHVCSTKICR